MRRFESFRPDASRGLRYLVLRFERASRELAGVAEAEEVIGKASGCGRIAKIHAHFHVLPLRRVREVRTGNKRSRPINDDALGVEARTGIACFQ